MSVKIYCELNNNYVPSLVRIAQIFEIIRTDPRSLATDNSLWERASKFVGRMTRSRYPWLNCAGVEA